MHICHFSYLSLLLSDTLSASYRGVTRNVRRSLLTMLGIIIGVGAVVLMSSVGKSMEIVILSQISSLGPKSMVIFPGQQEGGPSGVTTGFDSFTFDDLRELEKLKSIESIAPVIFMPGTASYEREEGSPQVFGIVPAFFQNQKISIEKGRLIDAADIEGASAVAMIGPDIVQKFFGNTDPLGKRMKIGTIHVTIIGVTSPLGSQFFQNADERIYVPFTLAKNVTNQAYINYATMLATDSFELAFDDVKFLLRQQHGINNPDDDPTKDDFVVRSSAQANEILGSVSLGLTLFITAIAGISLIVGGIGIMNIMIVTVTERIQEIGLRKALGAKRQDILLQFLIEAMLLTIIGGCLGMIGGLFSAFLLSVGLQHVLSTYTFVISLPSMIVSFGMATAVGLIFGISPAMKAARTHPMEALRYE